MPDHHLARLTKYVIAHGMRTGNLPLRAEWGKIEFRPRRLNFVADIGRDGKLRVDLLSTSQPAA